MNLEEWLIVLDKRIDYEKDRIKNLEMMDYKQESIIKKQITKEAEAEIILSPSSSLKDFLLYYSPSYESQKNDARDLKFKISTLPSTSRNFIEYAQRKKFKEDQGRFYIEITWTPEEFLREKTLKGLIANNLNISLSQILLSPEVRNGYKYTNDIIDIDCSNQTVKIHANTFNYSSHYTLGLFDEHLEELMTILKPQKAILKIEQERMNQLKEELGKFFLGSLLGSRLIKNPPKNPFLQDTVDQLVNYAVMQAGVALPEKISTIITKEVNYHFIPFIKRTLGLPLFNSTKNQKTRIESFTKTYSSFFNSDQNRLCDLQKIVEKLMNITPHGVLYDTPLITTTEAKNILEKEIYLIDKFFEDYKIIEHDYKNNLLESEQERKLSNSFKKVVFNLSYIIHDYFIGINPDDKRHGSSDRRSSIINITDGDSQEHFQSLGYVPSQSFTTRGTYADYLDEFGYCRDVFHWFKQLYEQNSEIMVNKTREYFINQKPTWKIYSTVSGDLSSLKKLKLPDKGEIESFSIRSGNYGDGKEMLSFSSKKESTVESRCIIPTLSSSVLFPLQAYIYEELGIKFIE